MEASIGADFAEVYRTSPLFQCAHHFYFIDAGYVVCKRALPAIDIVW